MTAPSPQHCEGESRHLISPAGGWPSDGGYTTISLIVFLAWTLVTSGWLAFRMGTERGDTTAYSTGDQA